MADGILRPLIALLDSEETGAIAIQTHVARCLTNLCSTDEHKRLILRSGALEKLSYLSEQSTGENQVVSSAVIASLASVMTPNSRRVLVRKAARSDSDSGRTEGDLVGTRRRGPGGRRGPVTRISPLAKTAVVGSWGDAQAAEMGERRSGDECRQWASPPVDEST